MAQMMNAAAMQGMDSPDAGDTDTPPSTNADEATEKDTGLDFTKPASLELPKGAADGGTVDMLATFKIDGDELCLIAVEGIPVQGDANEPNEEPDDSGSSFQGAIEKGL